MIDYLTPMRESLSKDSQRRLDENPLRVLDSKEKEDKVAVENAPSILDYLDEESQAHFDEVRTMLDSLNIPYVIDTNMVRGLDYYNHTIFLTGLTGILAMIPALYFYRRDKVRRIASGLIPAQKKVPLSISETVLLLLAGAGFAQYGNFLMAIFQSFINSSAYQESMTRITEGKSLLMMIFWMGIIAPAAEEMIFRWLIYLRLRDWLKMPVAAVISGVVFGIYHGNIVQGIYASILGTAFAWILEMSGNIYSSMLLHMGANIWSLLISEYALDLYSMKYGVQILILIYLILLISVVYCLTHFEKMCSIRKKKRMI